MTRKGFGPLDAINNYVDDEPVH